MKRIFLLIGFLLIMANSFGQNVWTAEMDSLAKQTERKYDLPHGICQAFALQESGYNRYALRAEGSYMTKGGTYAANIRMAATRFAVTHKYQPSILTEVVQRSESWGYFQVMGNNLRDLGLAVPYFQMDLTPSDQFEYFGRFISKLLTKHQGRVDYTASEYNGGANAIREGDFRNKPYVKAILRNMKQFTYK